MGLLQCNRQYCKIEDGTKQILFLMHNKKAVATLHSRQDDRFLAKCEEDSRYVQCQSAGSWVRCDWQSPFCEQSNEHSLCQHFTIWLSSRSLLIQRSSAC